MKLFFPAQLYFYFFLSKIVSIFLSRKPIPNTVLFLTALYPGNSGYHWRSKKWAEVLEEQGYKVDVLHAINEKGFRDYNNNPMLFMKRFLRKRFWQVLKARRYETVIVRREILVYNDYGNLFLEKMLVKLCNNRILDFDDDLAAAKNQPKVITSFFAKVLKENGSSFIESFSYFNKYIVASQYLKDYVLNNSKVQESQICIIPTCVDYDRYPIKKYENSKKELVFGWIGGDHNYHLLRNIVPILNDLSKSYSFRLIVIGGNPFQADSNFYIENKKWSLKTEVEDLYKIDVGLMPLNNSNQSKGKGGFKLIQYMGLGIVGVAQNVTVNADIVDDKFNSFLYNTDEELRNILEEILNNNISLDYVGRLARQKIDENYTFVSQTEKYITFIKWGLKKATNHKYQENN